MFAGHFMTLLAPSKSVVFSRHRNVGQRCCVRYGTVPTSVKAALDVPHIQFSRISCNVELRCCLTDVAWCVSVSPPRPVLTVIGCPGKFANGEKDEGYHQAERVLR